MDITPEIVDNFREYFPEFSDAEKWPSPTLTRFLTEAADEVGSRWGAYNYVKLSLATRGLFNYAAHKLTLWAKTTAATNAGVTPVVPGKVASKSVGDESTSYAVNPLGMDDYARYGDLTSTAYGVEFVRLRRRAGVGAVTV